MVDGCNVVQLLADDQEEIDVIPAGFIGAAAGLKGIRTGMSSRGGTMYCGDFGRSCARRSCSTVSLSNSMNWLYNICSLLSSTANAMLLPVQEILFVHLGTPER